MLCMGESGTSFLVECDIDSNILYTFWYQPPYLISPYQKMLGDLFSEVQRERVLRTIRETFEQKEMSGCYKTLSGKSIYTAIWASTGKNSPEKRNN